MLEVQSLSKSFKGLQAVREVSFEVPQGSIVALIGPNGAGKTTCFNMVAGAMRPSAGNINFAGRSIAGRSPEDICALGISRTFQIVRPFNGLTVLENVMVGAMHKGARVTEAMRAAIEVLDSLDMGSKAHMPASQLTLPDRKMLELARALATNPKLLLLDEVMAGLRPSEHEKIVELLRRLNSAGLTIFLIEHVMRVVMSLADRVLVLHHGEKIAEGTPEETTRDPKVIESYLGSRRKR